LDDDELLQRAHRLDENALATIFDTYYKPIFRYIYHQIHHVETAEDLAAKVFQRLLEQFSIGSGPTYHLKAWLFKVATNVLVDDSRRQRHRDYVLLEENEQQLLIIEENFETRLLVKEAKLALTQLTPQQRNVIILRYLVELSLEEVAEILDLTVGAVKALQHRGLVSLRRDLLHDQVTDGEHHA
jgi:RNA polymerase sigma-70 factor (ECF subfamily)